MSPWGGISHASTPPRTSTLLCGGVAQAATNADGGNAGKVGILILSVDGDHCVESWGRERPLKFILPLSDYGGMTRIGFVSLKSGPTSWGVVPRRLGIGCAAVYRL